MLGEHGMQNQALWGMEASKIDLKQMVDECTFALQEIQRLRDAGHSSKSLIDVYMRDWMIPIGSREWLDSMKLSVKHRDQPQWITRVTEMIS